MRDEDILDALTLILTNQRKMLAMKNSLMFAEAELRAFLKGSGVTEEVHYLQGLYEEQAEQLDMTGIDEEILLWEERRRKETDGELPD